jgi:hypothetical protein
MARYNSIFALRNTQGDYQGYPGANSTSIEPGMGLERIEEAGETRVQPVSTADSESTLIAREQRNPPRSGVGDPTDQTYNPGDNVECRNGGESEELYLRLASGTDLSTASDATVAKHDALSWYSDGTLYTGGTNPRFEALEAFDNSGAAAGETVLIAVKQQE